MPTEEGGTELYVVMLGSSQKSILFEKLCQAATKYERHVHYQDVHYLTVDCNGTEELLEFTDPGLARTGGREMAIKRADLALLFYSALSLSSLHNLQALKDNLEMKANVSTLSFNCRAQEAISRGRCCFRCIAGVCWLQRCLQNIGMSNVCVHISLCILNMYIFSRLRDISWKQNA
ncbi:unnamed protein product [Heligmosomoides polygyrus]|uniref:Ras-associating domain-containing protein n=1 Tax=Heligmosomoides polygyrus TaxID=6339 RepID=A0A183FVP7_HELPZ|nr:unnamed protein product [Heligmosomoides polygyrus]